jgi:hypothetical protein
MERKQSAGNEKRKEKKDEPRQEADKKGRIKRGHPLAFASEREPVHL